MSNYDIVENGIQNDFLVIGIGSHSYHSVNIVQSTIKKSEPNVDFAVVGCDLQALQGFDVDIKIPVVATANALDAAAQEQIRSLVLKYKMVFMVVSMADDIDAKLASTIASITHQEKVFAMVFAGVPFDKDKSGVETLSHSTNNVLIMPYNPKEQSDDTFGETLKKANETMLYILQGIVNNLSNPTISISIDFRDLKDCLTGKYSLVGFGRASSGDYVNIATKQAFDSLSLANKSLEKVGSVLVFVKAKNKISPTQLKPAMDILEKLNSETVTMFLSLAHDDTVDDDIQVTIITSWQELNDF